MKGALKAGEGKRGEAGILIELEERERVDG